MAKKRKASPEVDQVDQHVDQPPTEVDLTGNQLAFCQALAADPERRPWLAAWRAGYSGGSPDAEPPPLKSAARKNLASQASRVLKKPGVQRYLADLDRKATEAFLASPEGQAVVERTQAMEAVEGEAVDLAAKNLGIMVSIAHHDMRSVVTWGPGWVEVKESAELTYEEQLLVREVRHDETTGKDGSLTVTTTVKLADRMPYVRMLEARLGKLPPKKHEVSGPGGGPVQHEARVDVGPSAPSDELIDEMARRVLGGVPATRARGDDGIPLEEIRRVLAAWEADGQTQHVSPAELFSEENWPETRTRYLDGDNDE